MKKFISILFFAVTATMIFPTPEAALCGAVFGAIPFNPGAVLGVGAMVGVNPATQKLSRMNDKFGLKNANKMQGTSRELYDSLLLPDGTEQLTFFREAGSRVFPDTNLTENGNKLPVGYTFAMQGFYVAFVEEFSQPDPETAELQVDFLATPKWQHFRNAELDFYIGNSRVIQGLPLTGSLSFANRFAQSDKIVYLLDTPLIIPQDVQFYATMRIPGGWVIPVETGAKNRKMRLYLTGMGGILNLKTPV